MSFYTLCCLCFFSKVHMKFTWNLYFSLWCVRGRSHVQCRRSDTHARACVRARVCTSEIDRHLQIFTTLQNEKKICSLFHFFLVKKYIKLSRVIVVFFKKNLYFSDIALALWCARAHELEVINFSQDWKKKKKKYVFCTSCSEKNVKSFPASYLSIFHKKSSSFQTSSGEFYKGALTCVRVHEHMSPWCTTGK